MAKNNHDKIPVQALLVPKPILYFGKFLNRVSPFLASRFAARLFLTPFPYKMPNREKKMDQNSSQHKIIIESIQKEINVYVYGASKKKVLLVHGWSGSGTQLSIIAERLLQNGYSTVSFDAPAHGKARGKRSMMPYFIEAIHQLEKSHGPFHAAIGHSLGGMSLLRASKDRLPVKKLIIIGTANSITAITKNFVRNMQLDQKVATIMKAYFDKKFGEDMNNYSGAVSAKEVSIPTLIIHDKNDVDVHYSAAHEIHQVLKGSQLLITEKLGHRKILGNSGVIDKIISFIEA
ncbi:alpha/beta hydrolase [Aquimarina sp. TRL1]|uniref:alpha/beta fold hydrolase n=1 Tax=Aquimarina sp. (strain TRL1) TaxID=2736252 RepID=UPI001588C4AD|nr:alpha/beta hydrolase [Aquimarina sp. TRL1]QKX06576.1 alpha/beta hydrolase [Aquimarina sp. TRL1]